MKNIKVMLALGTARYLVRRESVAARLPTSKAGLGKRKPKGYRQARKKRRKQARAARRRGRQ